jgi:hypothetical protein
MPFRNEGIYWCTQNYGKPPNAKYDVTIVLSPVTINDEVKEDVQYFADTVGTLKHLQTLSWIILLRASLYPKLQRMFMRMPLQTSYKFGRVENIK